MTRSELVLFIATEVADLIGKSPMTVANLAKFGVSAVENNTSGKEKNLTSDQLQFIFKYAFKLSRNSARRL